MRWPRVRRARLLAPLGLALLLGIPAYAFMASNEVSASSVGSGFGTITGYTVSGITYGLSLAPGDPDNLFNVGFRLTPVSGNLAAQQVAVWFDKDKANVASSLLGTCRMIDGPTADGSTDWVCSLNLLDLEAGPNTAMTLHVAAAH